MRKPIGNQGEIRIDQIDALAENLVPFTERCEAGTIISHSERGNHHILGGDVQVMERTDVPKGAKILQAIVTEPTALFQDATTPHQPIYMPPGIYQLTIKRDFDPFTGQARLVAD